MQRDRGGFVCVYVYVCVCKKWGVRAPQNKIKCLKKKKKKGNTYCRIGGKRRHFGDARLRIPGWAKPNPELFLVVNHDLVLQTAHDRKFVHYLEIVIGRAFSCGENRLHPAWHRLGESNIRFANHRALAELAWSTRRACVIVAHPPAFFANRFGVLGPIGAHDRRGQHLRQQAVHFLVENVGLQPVLTFGEPLMHDRLVFLQPTDAFGVLPTGRRPNTLALVAHTPVIFTLTL